MNVCCYCFSSECSNFVKSYDRNDLPADYPKSETGVDKPEDFHLEGTEYVYGNKVYPKILIKWKSPKSGMCYIVGQFLMISDGSFPQQVCNGQRLLYSQPFRNTCSSFIVVTYCELRTISTVHVKMRRQLLCLRGGISECLLRISANCG